MFYEIKFSKCDNNFVFDLAFIVSKIGGDSSVADRRAIDQKVADHWFDS